MEQSAARIVELEESVKEMKEENQKLSDTANKAVKKEERAKGWMNISTKPFMMTPFSRCFFQVQFKLKFLIISLKILKNYINHILIVKDQIVENKV